MIALPRVVPAAVTPFSEGGAQVMLDYIPQYLAYIERRGADGVLALGTNGEGLSLSLQERKEIIDAFLTHQGRLFTMFGTGCAALPETIELSRYALERGAGAVMIVPPFYFKDVDERGLISYYSELMGALPPERKVLLYNIPSVSGVEIGDELREPGQDPALHRALSPAHHLQRHRRQHRAGASGGRLRHDLRLRQRLRRPRRGHR